MSSQLIHLSFLLALEDYKVIAEISWQLLEVSECTTQIGDFIPLLAVSDSSYFHVSAFTIVKLAVDA